MTVKELITILQTFDENSIIECTIWGKTYSGMPVLGNLEKDYIYIKEYEGGISAVVLGEREPQDCTLS